MLIPYNVDVPMYRLPIANWALMGLIAVVSVGAWMNMGPGRTAASRDAERLFQQLEQKQITIEEFERQLDRIATQSQGPTFPLALTPQNFRVLHLVTHTMVHGDILHLLGNLFFLFVFGNAINAKLGHAWFLTAFFLLGIVGGLAWLLLGSGQPVVGASGAIMGIMGMFLVLYPRNDVTVLYGFGMWAVGSFTISSWWVIASYVGIDLLQTVRGAQTGVAHAVHLGGAVAGMLLTIVLIRAGWIESDRGEENLLEWLGGKDEPRKVRKSRTR